MNTTNTNDPDEILCPCSGTKRSKIQSLVEQGFDADTISRKTGAISGCGGCEWDIAEMVEDFIASQNKPSE